MQAAELKVRLGRTEEALHDFEAMLGKLRPDSWLHKEVRRKIEEVFLRNDDRAGLVDLLRAVDEARPRGRRGPGAAGPDARRRWAGSPRRSRWYEKAIKLAPGRRDLRLALIGQLAQDQKYAEAAAQYEALDRAEPNNPDTLRDWGALVLRDTSKPEAERKAAAAAIWRKLLETKPKDAVTDRAGRRPAAPGRDGRRGPGPLPQGHRAGPGNPQYHEYLGEYLHQLKRPDEAMAEWAKIAEGPNRNAKNLARLAEVLSGFGYIKEAIAPLTRRSSSTATTSTCGMKLAELLHRAERFDDAEAQLAAADEAGGARRGEGRGARGPGQERPGGRPAHRAGRGHAQGAGGRRRSATAGGLVAAGPLPRGRRQAPRGRPRRRPGDRGRPPIGPGLDAGRPDPRVGRQPGRRRRRPTAAWPRSTAATGPSTSRRIARLESRLGRDRRRPSRPAATCSPPRRATPSITSSSPSSASSSAGPTRASTPSAAPSRVNSNDTKILLTLAETLAGQFRTEEAIEMYWRAFDKAEDLDDKLGVVSRLTELYLQRNQLDRLLTRLQHQERDVAEPATQREVSICLAQAYATSGDLGMARSELERLLAANARDTQLLQQLSKLAEEEGDLEGAARYQKQLIELAPSDEGAAPAGASSTSATATWRRRRRSGRRWPLARRTSQHMLQAIDSLLGSEKPPPCWRSTESMIRKDPHDWEALYREGLALAELGKKRRRRAAVPPAARPAAQRRRQERDRQGPLAQPEAPVRRRTARRASAARQPLPLEIRVSAAFQVRRATRLETRIIYSTSTTSTIWTPGGLRPGPHGRAGLAGEPGPRPG